MMHYGPQLAEGKTKIIYAHPSDANLAIMAHKDGISAGDGARRNVIVGKGALSGRTAGNVFTLLNQAGVATHYVESLEPTVMVVKRCSMIPVEVVMRRLATGSYLKRHPDVAEATRFAPPLVEFFLKDDARHDPQISAEEMIALGLAAPADVEQICSTGLHVFATLEAEWAKQQITLVDLKLEFGRTTDGTLIVADMIDNDSWRLWPSGDKAQMLDKQVYRNMAEITDEGLADIRRRYETVAALTDGWRTA